MYELLTGQPPFPEQKETSTDFNNFTIPKRLSESARDLLLNLLCIDPVDRISSRAILQHEWVVNSVRKYESERRAKYKLLHE